MNAAFPQYSLGITESDPPPRRRPRLPPRRLQPLYYLHNFRAALAVLGECYAGLLNAEEIDFIQQFERLSVPAQCLLTRLIMRKGPWFRRSSLHYQEVADLDVALDELVRRDWLDLNPLLAAQDLFQCLDAKELRLALGVARGRWPRGKHCEADVSQLSLPLQDSPAPTRALADWHPALKGRMVRLRIGALLKRLQRLFFGNHRQSWAEFVLTDLGVNRYERVALPLHARAFQTREEILDFYRLNECRERLDAGEAASLVHASAWTPKAGCAWLRAGFTRLHLRIGALLEAQGNPQGALQSYRECGNAEGLVRMVRLLVALGLREAAQGEALKAQALSCSEAQQEAMSRALSRGERGHKRVSRRRTLRKPVAVIELEIPKPPAKQHIELAVVARLSQPDAPVFFAENSLISSLFGLLCWEALFAPIPGAFFHPFQTGPADLYTDEFRTQRAQQLETLLGLLDTGQHAAVIQRVYREKAGIRTHFVRWRRLRPHLLTLALHCIPASHLRLCFERLLDDLKENATGLPDLIQFWPATQRYRLIEVKGPGDRLKDNQRRWLTFFERHAMPAAVCHVRWQTTAERE